MLLAPARGLKLVLGAQSLGMTPTCVQGPRRNGDPGVLFPGALSPRWPLQPSPPALLEAPSAGPAYRQRCAGCPRAAPGPQGARLFPAPTGQSLPGCSGPSPAHSAFTVQLPWEDALSPRNPRPGATACALHPAPPWGPSTKCQPGWPPADLSGTWSSGGGQKNTQIQTETQKLL